MSIISRIQKDALKFQGFIQKEGVALVERINVNELCESFENRRRNLEALIHKRIKKFEPTYQILVEDLRKNAKKAGIDIDRIERSIKDTACVASDKVVPLRPFVGKPRTASTGHSQNRSKKTTAGRPAGRPKTTYADNSNR